jgi:hypothetical protein
MRTAAGICRSTSSITSLVDGRVAEAAVSASDMDSGASPPSCFSATNVPTPRMVRT